MPFSLFTRRSRDPSTRLCVIARLFQIGVVVSLLGSAFSLYWFLHSPVYANAPAFNRVLRVSMTVFLLYPTLSAISYFLIGRDLLHGINQAQSSPP